jgi:hypothetical protein
LALIGSRSDILVAVSELSRIEFPGAALDDRAGDGQHLGINGTSGVPEPRSLNLVGGAQRDQHHPSRSRCGGKNGDGKV